MKNLKKVIAVLLAVVTVAFAFAACSGSKTDKSTSDYDKVVKSGKIVVGVTVYEPMDYKDKDGNWTGFDAELAEAVAKKMGVKAEFVAINWDNRFTELASGTVDCLWNGMTIDDSVKANCSLSNPYATNSQVVVMKRTNLQSIKTPHQCRNLTLRLKKVLPAKKRHKRFLKMFCHLLCSRMHLKKFTQEHPTHALLTQQWQMP